MLIFLFAWSFPVPVQNVKWQNVDWQKVETQNFESQNIENDKIDTVEWIPLLPVYCSDPLEITLFWVRLGNRYGSACILR